VRGLQSFLQAHHTRYPNDANHFQPAVLRKETRKEKERKETKGIKKQQKEKKEKIY